MKGLGGATKAAVVINVGAIGAVLAVNLITRVIMRVASPGGDDAFVKGLWSLGPSLAVSGVLVAVASFIWTKRHLIGKVVGDALVVISISSLLIALLGVYVSGGNSFGQLPFSDAFANMFLMLMISLGALIVAAVIGGLIAMALGLDPKSRAWKAQAQSVRATARKRQRKATKAGAKSLR
jgi:hypothetical protein